MVKQHDINLIKKISRYLVNRIYLIRGKIVYAKESIKNRYPCSLIKYEKIDDRYAIFYCVLGKKDNVHRTSINCSGSHQIGQSPVFRK